MRGSSRFAASARGGTARLSRYQTPGRNPSQSRNAVGSGQRRANRVMNPASSGADAATLTRRVSTNAAVGAAA